jgi:hypothetical protein
MPSFSFVKITYVVDSSQRSFFYTSLCWVYSKCVYACEGEFWGKAGDASFPFQPHTLMITESLAIDESLLIKLRALDTPALEPD